MAVQFNAKHSRTSEYRFFPEDIVVKPSLNGRYDKPDIEALIQDIVVNGQHTPVVIRNDGGKPVLCAGYSRYRAVSEINRRKLMGEPIALRCTYSQCSEAEGFLAAISENRFRNTTTELDDAHNIARLMKVYAKTEDEVANIYFPGVAGDRNGNVDLPALREALKFVRRRLALINLTPAAEKAMRDGKLKGSAAVAIAKLDSEHQEKALASKNGHKKPKGTKTVSLKDRIKLTVASGTIDVNGCAMKIEGPVLDWLRSLVE
jgi:ParB-like chromosome segregation protein Spo0J